MNTIIGEMKKLGIKEYIIKSSDIGRVVQSKPFWKIPAFAVGRKLKMVKDWLGLEGQVAYEERIKKEKE